MNMISSNLNIQEEMQKKRCRKANKSKNFKTQRRKRKH